MLAEMPWSGNSVDSNVVRFVSTDIWKLWCAQADEDMPLLYQNICSFNFALHHDTGLFSQDIWPDLRHPTPDITSLFLKLNTWVCEHISIDSLAELILVQGIDNRRAINSLYKILRSEPECSTDQRLFEKYVHLIKHEGTEQADFSYVSITLI